ncbi:hypothetical protein [Methylophaga sulfidovorans]|uniref:Uncharacterized protein n=1 Tax=Methylophaga sulfidovorans TaxID=45496 RepID=A0A1I3ZY42_9GAMM|nr:hypothetical protein [Methylophaga sulfidovorans]SFK48807.1 hypothetical protein SAMN04488079_11273 [Methylophaga sulfidovorans]
MKISGKDAVLILAKHPTLVDLHKKDQTDKFWSYKLKVGSRAEFAFDPHTKRDLIIRFDQEPPKIPGVEKIENLGSKSISTALDRVFSGGKHTAKFKAVIFDESTLLSVIRGLT